MSQKNQGDSANVFPVGAVIAFAGATDQLANDDCWINCDGSSQTIESETKPLQDVIGTMFGASSGDSFCVPKCQGLFIRGVDSGSGRDPDASSRGPARSDLSQSGNNAPHVGTVQQSAFTNHSHSYFHYHNEHRVGTITGDTFAGNDTQKNNTDPSGGKESRPVNQYVNYFIKSKNNTDSDGEISAGMVLAYGGDLTSEDDQAAMKDKGWLLCDGSLLENSDYNDLSKALSTGYGSDGPSSFAIPCYFGRFHRACDDDSNIDPDASSRSAPGTEFAQYGNSGSEVGTVQGDEFPSHYHQFTHQKGTNKSQDGDVYTVIASSNFPEKTGSSGSGPETRPKNAAVEYVIASENDSASDFSVPPGVIIAYAGDAEDSSVIDDLKDQGWLLCDGSQYSQSDYSDLFNAIGFAHGGTSSDFCVPDYRGRFLRAVDHGAGVDPDASSRGVPQSGLSHQGNSGDKVGSVQGHALKNHQHSYDINNGAMNTVLGGARTLKDDSTTDTTSNAMGNSIAISSENRPVNLYLYFLIKSA